MDALVVSIFALLFYTLVNRTIPMKHVHMNSIFRASKQNKNVYILLTQMAAFLKIILVIHKHSNFPLSLPLILQSLRIKLTLQK